MNFQFNIRRVKYVYEDVLKLYARFGYNEFIKADTFDLNLRYSVKRLSNDAVISRVSKAENKCHYKVNKFGVEVCQKFKETHE